MKHQVTFIFSPDQRLEYTLNDLDLSEASIEAAQQWLYAKWEELECEPFRPSGKVLLLDRILGIAQEVGYHELNDHPALAENFAKHIAIALDSAHVTVDMPALIVAS